MGLFDGFRRARELARLEKDARERPSPITFGALAGKLIAADDLNRALEVVTEAMRLFPDSERVQQTYKYLKKSKLEKEMHEIGRTLATAPTPQLCNRLAHLYHRELGDLDKALGTLRDGVSRFPASGDLHLGIGEIRLARFHRDWLNKDGLEAIVHLKKAITIDPSNYKAHMYLANLYLEIGAVDKCSDVLRKVLKTTPDDGTALELMEKVKTVPSSGPTDEALLLEQVEERRGPLVDLSRLDIKVESAIFKRADLGRIAPEAAATSIRSFESLEGVIGAGMLDENGKCIAKCIPAKLDAAVLGEMIGLVTHAALDASLKMDIGSFARGTIEGSFGYFVLRRIGNHTLGILADENARPRDIDLAVNTFLGLIRRESQED